MTSYFITGIGTNVGKTIASIAVLQAANSAGWKTAGYKPISCGRNEDTIYNNDALMLKKYSNIELTYEQVNPFNFLEPTSPHLNSIKEGKPILLETISLGLKKLELLADLVVIEGIGGWYTPISSQETLANWVIKEKLPVILVVNINIGCINHAILTYEAIKINRLTFIGWIANRTSSSVTWDKEYLYFLRKRLQIPYLGAISWLNNQYEFQNFGHYIKLPLEKRD